MEIDKTTLNDLSIFNNDEEFSVFNKLNYTLTSNGKEQLRQNLSVPLKSIEAIEGIQQTLKQIIELEDQWPKQISNGTIKVIERFYESTFDPLPEIVSSVTAYSYKLLHGPDYSFVKFSAIHCFDFIKGLQSLIILLQSKTSAAPLNSLLKETAQLIHKQQFDVINKNQKATDLTPPEALQLARYLRYHFKHSMTKLLDNHAKIDAWYGMAMATKKLQLTFPVFSSSPLPLIEIQGLSHVLLQNPVAYNVHLNRETNFLFLTGANMAGKSTFIKAVGTAVFLAHTGMGVPAKKMELGLFDGMLSNINVMDNIVKGESYFYNEVQRIKATIQKVNDGRKWLILIDELFKGTNVQDAMKCSTTVIEGLLKIKNSLFILSTHLYEIGEDLKVNKNIHFSYFETKVVDDQLNFNYQLKDGISNDRLGYLILKKEGVVKMLEDL